MSDHDHQHHGDDHEREHDRPLSGPALRVKALESLLTEKGLVDPKALDDYRHYERKWVRATAPASWRERGRSRLQKACRITRRAHCGAVS